MSRNNYKNYGTAIVLAGFIFALAAGVFAANQIKTTETFIIGTPDVLNPSIATSSELTLYIGDNLSGVANPVKSAQVAVSGVYTSTADGSIAVQLGSDLQTFIMKNVSTPTPFEILYNATGTTDAITSAGTYNYTLTVTPSAQITIYGLSAKLVESHEYVPATCADGSPDNEKVKTTETFIIGAPDVLNPSTATSSALTLYIGDNLSGVTNPVKSAQVAVSGIYTSTADGSITVQLGSDLQTFTMKDVSAPTPFEILYNATGTTDAITSAGTYNYTLTITPSAQITIYGLSAKLAESHEYVPASCADGQPANEKVKTTETFIIGTPDVLNPSTATSSELTLYIGDNLSGVTNPVKSAQVAVSGVYTSTADGSIAIQLGSDLQTFIMKNVSTPTPFEILYNATGTTDAITSAGTYNYTLTVTPSAQIT